MKSAHLFLTLPLFTAALAAAAAAPVHIVLAAALISIPIGVMALSLAGRR